MAEFNGKQGVWRTIGGRRVFIEDGDDLKTAMKKSGKFKKNISGKVTREEVFYEGAKHEDELLLNNQRHLRKELGNIGDRRLEKNKRDYNSLNLSIKDVQEKRDEISKNVSAYYHPEEFRGKVSPLEGKHINSSKYQEIEQQIKNSYDGELRDISKGYAYPIASDPDSKREQIEVRKLAKQEIMNRAVKNAQEDNRKLRESERTTKEVNDEYNKLSKKMQQDDYYYRYEDDRKLKELRAEYDTLVAKGQEDVNLTEYNNRNKTPYNSKAYAKLLSESYMADEEYEDKVTPKYIQDIEAGRYGNMSDEEAIKNWIDGGADIIYNEDAEKQLKAWGIPVKNDDAYGTYKDELAKQLLPIYKRDRSKATLSKMALGDLREIARDYNLETKGLSRKELIEKLLSTFGK